MRTTLGLTAMLLGACIVSVGRAGEWHDIPIPHLELNEATPKEACDEINKQCLNTYGRTFEFRFDFDPPDPRCGKVALATNAHVTLKLHNVPLRDAVRYVAGVCGVRHRFEQQNIVIFEHTLKGFLCLAQPVSPMLARKGRTPPFCCAFIENFDRRIELWREQGRLGDILDQISRVTQTEIIFDEDVETLLRTVDMTFPKRRFTAFELLKACVESLRRVTKKDVVLYQPRTATVMGLQRQVQVMALGVRPAGLLDVRAALPLMPGESEPKDGKDTYEKRLAKANEMLQFRNLFYEPSLNAIWAVAQPSGGLPYITLLNVVPHPPEHAHIVSFGPNGEVIIKDGPKLSYPPERKPVQSPK